MTSQRTQNRRRRRSTLIGVLVVAVLTAVVLFAVTAQHGLPSYLPGVQRGVVKAAFSDAGALRVGDDVRIADVRVGYVSDLDLVDGTPVATLQLDEQRPVHSDATAAVGARSALGQKYVDLNPGTEGAGDLGDAVIGRTTPSQELDTLLNVLDEPTREAAASTLREVGGGLAGHSTDLKDGIAALPTMLPDLGTVSEALSEDGGRSLSDLLTDADRLARSFADRQQSIAATVRHLDPTLAAVNTGGGDRAREVLDQAPETMREARVALDDLRAPLASTREAVTVVRPGATALGEATPDLRGVLREAVTPLDKVPGVADSADPAVTDLTPTVSDLRPLARQLGTTMAQGAPTLDYLGAYSGDISNFFTFFADTLSTRDQLGHGIRIYPVVKPEMVLNNLPVEDPTVHRDAYPVPGGTFDHHATTVIGGRR
ncbi:MlaD family protein [Pseudonocardia halophobica]|uniref:MlaD family protein n=1 Tax=Pseudonocardia halophobica TaxID=29401 RepID=UPI003D94AD72